MNGKETIQKITAECARVLLGVVFIFSGTVKAIDPVGGAIKIDDYLVAFHLEFLKIFSILLSMNLSALEFTLGVCMLLGVYVGSLPEIQFVFDPGVYVGDDTLDAISCAL